jgi:hypothetical protein
VPLGEILLKKKSSLLAKLENNRISVFTEDLDYCYFFDKCHRKREDYHEILYGSNRKNSMIYGFVLPLCREHHQMFHDNHKLTREWSKKCQEYWEKNYSTFDDWMDIFHRNYKD